MAFRNENGYMRQVNTTASAATTATPAGDNDRSVISIKFIFGFFYFIFFQAF